MEKYISEVGLTIEAVAICWGFIMLVMLIQTKVK